MGVKWKWKRGVAGHPKANFRVLVGGVVVDHQMDIQITGDVGIDVTQKLQELLVAVALFALSHHAASWKKEPGRQISTGVVQTAAA